MIWIVGDFINPSKETDEIFLDMNLAFKRLMELSEERENFLVGLWEEDSDYALFVSINGETFKAMG
jgi:hypothetical protein